MAESTSPHAETGASGTCTSCGERVRLADWPEHRERVHGHRSEPAIPSGQSGDTDG